MCECRDSWSIFPEKPSCNPLIVLGFHCTVDIPSFGSVLFPCRFSSHAIYTGFFFPHTFALHFYEDYEGLVEIALANAFQLVLAEIIVYITCTFKCSHVRNQLFLSPGSQLMVERSFVMERSAQVAALSL